MKNLNFLSTGQIFPPLEEAKRIGACAEYDLMYDGNTYAVEEMHFRQTLNNLNRLAVLLGWTDSYVAVEYNYFQLCSIKTADFVCGELPDIVSAAKDEKVRARQQKVLDDIRKSTNHDVKFYDGAIDVSKYGESYLRVYARDGKNTYTLQSPAIIIRVTDEEDDYEVLNYVVAWLTDNDTRLQVRIHGKGSYTKREYRVTAALTDDLSRQKRYRHAGTVNGKSDLYTLIQDRYTDEVFRCRLFKIAEQIGKDEVVPTYLDDFAIIQLSNVKNSDRTRGMSDYDRFDSVVASIQRTMTEVQLILDKYIAPSMAVPEDALTECDSTGENIMEIGKAIGVPDGGIIPQFLEPDLSKLEMCYRQLEFNVARIKELSEMGAALSSETNVSNISTETMRAQFASACKKAERLTTRNEGAVKKLFHLLSMHGYGEVIPEDDITITWYDGLPNDEEKEVRVAAAKVQAGLSNRKEEYMNRFCHTEEQADSMWDRYLQEQNDLNQISVAGAFNPFAAPNEDTDAGGDSDGNAETPPAKPEDNDE